MHITTHPLKMIMSAYHTITKLGHNIVLKEIQHLTGMTQCASLPEATPRTIVDTEGTIKVLNSCAIQIVNT
jgi:hypothetical protein